MHNEIQDIVDADRSQQKSMMVQQPPVIPPGLSPSPLPGQRQQGAAPGIFAHLQYCKACSGGRPPAGSVPRVGSPQIFTGSVEPISNHHEAWNAAALPSGALCQA